jgi:hypothetical protein
VENGTAYLKRRDVEPTTELPGRDKPWSKPLDIGELVRELAPLLYQRSMSMPSPEVWHVVWDEAAAEAVRGELASLGVKLEDWWDGHYRPAATAVAHSDLIRRRGGYSSGGFI